MISTFHYNHLEFWTDLSIGVLTLQVHPCTTVSEISTTNQGLLTITTYFNYFWFLDEQWKHLRESILIPAFTMILRSLSDSSVRILLRSTNQEHSRHDTHIRRVRSNQSSIELWFLEFPYLWFLHFQDIKYHFNFESLNFQTYDSRENFTNGWFWIKTQIYVRIIEVWRQLPLISYQRFMTNTPSPGGKEPMSNEQISYHTSGTKSQQSKSNSKCRPKKLPSQIVLYVVTTWSARYFNFIISYLIVTAETHNARILDGNLSIKTPFPLSSLIPHINWRSKCIKMFEERGSSKNRRYRQTSNHNISRRRQMLLWDTSHAANSERHFPVQCNETIRSPPAWTECTW